MLQPVAQRPAMGQAGPMPDPEVPERPVRRRFSAAYKLRVVEEANAATEPGQVGALLRREGLYSSHLVDWRRLYRSGALGGPRPPQRSSEEARPAGRGERAPPPAHRPPGGAPGHGYPDHRDPGKSCSWRGRHHGRMTIGTRRPAARRSSEDWCIFSPRKSWTWVPTGSTVCCLPREST